MKPFHKHFIAAFGLLTVIAVTPSSAYARPEIHLNLPGISIGVHDDHGYRKHKRHHRKQHRKHHRRYHNDYYYNDRYYNNRRYHNRKYNERRYYKRRHNDNYYYGGRRNNRGYYNDGYRSQYCPTAGYSRYYDRNRDCYSHKGHYHCT